MASPHQLALSSSRAQPVVTARAPKGSRRLAATPLGVRRRGLSPACAREGGEGVLGRPRDDDGVSTNKGAEAADGGRAVGRRDALSAAALGAGLLHLGPSAAAAAAYDGDAVEQTIGGVAASASAKESSEADQQLLAAMAGIPDYSLRGPYGVRRLPKLEHTCVSCFPRCVGDACLLSIDAYVPSAPPPLPDTMFPLGGAAAAAAAAATASSSSPELSRGPYPLAVLTSGFLVDAEQYASYARRLCSWGYVVVQYNKRDSVGVAGGNTLVGVALFTHVILQAKHQLMRQPVWSVQCNQSDNVTNLTPGVSTLRAGRRGVGGNGGRLDSVGAVGRVALAARLLRGRGGGGGGRGRRRG
jgi:hypothetical protein